MSASPRPFIVGNWKMFGLGASLREVEAVRDAAPGLGSRLALCLPATLISRAAEAVGAGGLGVGGQDCRAEPEGAFTGDVSAAMLADAGATLVILGHSERRAGHGETDAAVAAKVEAALAAGLEPIVCVGETLTQRDAGQAGAVVEGQLAGSLPAGLAGRGFAVAYEPVWAIGTGRTPTPEQIADMHRLIRRVLTRLLPDGGARAPVLYGGSVKPDNAAAILATEEVGGALVGGASLKAADFLRIAGAA